MSIVDAIAKFVIRPSPLTEAAIEIGNDDQAMPLCHASTERYFDMAFASLGQLQAGALMIAPDLFFTRQSKQLAGLAMRHVLPAIYWVREFGAFGGLMSYGASLANAFHLAGVYTTRVLKGDEPRDCRCSSQPNQS